MSGDLTNPCPRVACCAANNPCEPLSCRTTQFFYEGEFLENKYTRPWFFSWTFCIAACTIISGCLAERTALAAYPAATLLIAAIVHPLLVHWIWNPQVCRARGQQQTCGQLTAAACVRARACVRACVRLVATPSTSAIRCVRLTLEEPKAGQGCR